MGDDELSDQSNQSLNNTSSDNDISSQSSSLLEKSARFEDPIMNTIFTCKQALNTQKYTSTCNGCDAKIKTREVKRLKNHYFTCPSRDEKIVADLKSRSSATPPSASDDLNILFAKVIAENNLPFNLLESISWKEFIKRGIPSWRCYSRKKYASVLIPELAKQAQDVFMSSINAGYNFQVTIEFDGWESAQRESYLGILLTKSNGQHFLHSLIDTSSIKHTGENLSALLTENLKSIPKGAINALVSDSASNCKLARKLFLQQDGYKQVIHHRCWAHQLNNLGNHISDNEPLKDIIDWAMRLTSAISRNIVFLSRIREAKESRPQYPSNVRWYSLVDMIEKLIIIRETLETSIDLFKDDAKQMIEDENNWQVLENSQILFRRIADCIAIAERESGSLSETVKVILELGRWLFAANWNDSVTLQAISSYLQYVGIESNKPDRSRQYNEERNDEFGLLLACYLLDHRYKQNYVTDDGKAIAYAKIMQIANDMGMTRDIIMTRLKKELVSFSRNEDEYNDAEFDSNLSAIDWWSKFGKGGYLKSIAIRLASLKASSGNIERTFSSIRQIQGLNRLSFNLETLIALTQLRVYKSEAKSHGDLREINEEYQPNDHRPELLGPKARELYHEFKKFVDFALRNRPAVRSEIIEQPIGYSELAALATEVIEQSNSQENDDLQSDIIIECVVSPANFSSQSNTTEFSNH